MKNFVLISIIFFVFALNINAQQKTTLDKPKDAYHPAYGEPTASTKAKKNRNVQEKQKDYFKQAKKESAKKKDCDCPGNPKNKMNKRNPYKRKRGY